MPFFPLPSPLPLSLLSGCVRCGGCSSGAAAPAVICDEPDDQTAKTRYGTVPVAVTEVTDEEEYDGCDGANPRHRLDNAFLSLADVILLRLIVATTVSATATAVGSTATTTMLMPAINVVMVHRAGGLGG